MKNETLNGIFLQKLVYGFCETLDISVLQGINLLDKYSLEDFFKEDNLVMSLGLDRAIKKCIAEIFFRDSTQLSDKLSDAEKEEILNKYNYKSIKPFRSDECDIIEYILRTSKTMLSGIHDSMDMSLMLREKSIDTLVVNNYLLILRRIADALWISERSVVALLGSSNIKILKSDLMNALSYKYYDKIIRLLTNRPAEYGELKSSEIISLEEKYGISINLGYTIDTELEKKYERCTDFSECILTTKNIVAELQEPSAECIINRYDSSLDHKVEHKKNLENNPDVFDFLDLAISKLKNKNISIEYVKDRIDALYRMNKV